MNLPTVSIIIPCFNQAKYLSDALTSVLHQNYQSWECIIVNDGSTDDTATIARKWVLKDDRIQYIEQHNKGLSEARNTGIKKAIGTFILPLDSDDKIGTEYVERAVSEFRTEPATKLVYCEAALFGVKTGRWNLPEFSLALLKSENMIFCSAMFRKSDWKKLKGYDSKLIYGLEDWEFWIHLLKKGGRVKKLDYLGFFYRVKSQSMIVSMSLEEKNWSVAYIRKKHHKFYSKSPLKKLVAYLRKIRL